MVVDGQDLKEIRAGLFRYHLGNNGGVPLFDHANVVLLTGAGEIDHHNVAAGGFLCRLPVRHLSLGLICGRLLCGRFLFRCFGRLSRCRCGRGLRFLRGGSRTANRAERDHARQQHG